MAGVAVMDKEKLFNALDGLFAYDSGSVSSGIHEPGLKRDVMLYLLGQCGPHELYPDIAAEFLRDYYLSPPYGIEDAKKFIEWLDENLEKYRGELP
jgi:hypothetical protein